MKVLASVFIFFNQIFETEMSTITEKPVVVRKIELNELCDEERRA